MGAIVAAVLLSTAPLPVTLVDGAQVAALCRALADEAPEDPGLDLVDRATTSQGWVRKRQAALAKTYSVRVPAAYLHLQGYDPERHELALDDRWALVGAGGALSLWPAEDEPWALSAAESDVRRVRALDRAGKLWLEVRFHPPAGGCMAVSWGHFSMQVDPGSLELRSNDGSLHLAGAGDWSRSVESAAAVVRLLSPVVQAGRADAPSLVKAVEADEGLRRCYEAALEATPDTAGSVVVLATFAAGGQVSATRVAFDAIGDPSLSDCLRRRLEALRLPGGEGEVYLPLELDRR